MTESLILPSGKVIGVASDRSAGFIWTRERRLYSYGERMEPTGCIELESPVGNVICHDDRVYISCRGKMVICDRDLREVLLELDATDPKRDSGIQGKACLVGSRMVCFGSNNKRLWCFDRHTGELLETIRYPDFISATPVFDGERLYVCCLDGTITCYDASEYLD